MATLKELLGDNYKEGMTFADIETVLAGKNLADLSTGDYVSKGKLEGFKNRAETAEKKLAERMTEEEKNLAAQQAKEAETAKILKENRYLRYKADWGGTIGDPDALEKMANYYADGDYDKLNAAQKKWYEASIKQAAEKVRTELAGQDAVPAPQAQQQADVHSMTMEQWNELKNTNPALYDSLLKKI